MYVPAKAGSSLTDKETPAPLPIQPGPQGVIAEDQKEQLSRDQTRSSDVTLNLLLISAEASCSEKGADFGAHKPMVES